MTLSNFIVEEEMEKEKTEANSLSFTNSQLFMGENQFGSPGRVRAIKKNRMFFRSNGWTEFHPAETGEPWFESFKQI